MRVAIYGEALGKTAGTLLETLRYKLQERFPETWRHQPVPPPLVGALKNQGVQHKWDLGMHALESNKRRSRDIRNIFRVVSFLVRVQRVRRTVALGFRKIIGML